MHRNAKKMLITESKHDSKIYFLFLLFLTLRAIKEAHAYVFQIKLNLTYHESPFFKFCKSYVMDHVKFCANAR